VKRKILDIQIFIVLNSSRDTIHDSRDTNLAYD